MINQQYVDITICWVYIKFVSSTICWAINSQFNPTNSWQKGGENKCQCI